MIHLKNIHGKISPLLGALLLMIASLAAFAHHTDAQPTITEPWVRQPVPGRGMSAAYMTIENPDHAADFLLSATCDCAGRVELHVMKMENDIMKMEKVERLEVPAKGKLELKPGGAHIMLFDLKDELAADSTTTLKLRFANAGEVEVKATVRSPKESGHDH